MLLEFIVYELKKESKMYEMLMGRPDATNEFIIVGEEKMSDGTEYFKVQQLNDYGLKLIGGLLIDEAAYDIKKSDLETSGDIGIETTELDIPKEYLTLDIVDNIIRLNR